jgi:hypothetical protein
MPYMYPPIPPSISSDVETINRFLQSPTLVARRLRTLLEQRFIGDTLLSARAEPQGGAIVYEQSETIYTDRAVEAVAPGGEYPLTTVSTGPAQVAKSTVKWGQDTYITDEAIKRLGFNPVDRAMLKLVNTLVKQVDSVCLSLIASAVTQTQALRRSGRLVGDDPAGRAQGEGDDQRAEPGLHAGHADRGRPDPRLRHVRPDDRARDPA